ncbi:actin-like ATPase domain-containing protein [Aspergillus ellipticus CBS 707.79]|uniref:Actin-like ATPase domain-containing protein n=1 Tax=Aspergillus ellipticus CBS 707.79 TaxID=1448320 RepID=A0A319E317_9EURO|nr:actin-like ATPase domain-containing protein [Aspergillus ellipticus CBS 707.79]
MSEEHTSSMAQGPSIVVGVDFGTTFSGIAWAFNESVNEIEVMSTWPGGGNRTSVKAPSIISYGAQNSLWGYQVGPFTDAFRGIKLLLDEHQQTTYPPSLNSKILLQKYKINATQVTADYLQHVVRYAEEVLERRLGVPARAMNIRFVLTVPAVWSDKAKDSTLLAAVKAGISAQDISLVSEPEAAALYSLRAIQPNAIAKNDVFIVCDAGGGTVDLISYQIRELEPLALVEVVKGAGRICGSMLLDQRFERLLEQRMRPNGYATLTDKSKEAALTYWQDRVKPNFTGKFDDDFADVDYFIPIPGAQDDPSVPIEDGFFQLTSEDVTQIFEPIIQDVELLVAEQIKGIEKKQLSPKAILLVGGFGSSEFLFRRLQEANPTVTVMQPPDAWSAVVSGAVHRGLDGNRVESRIARRNYGIEYRTRYIDGVHQPQDKVWDDLEERYDVHGRMSWYIKKYSNLSENKPIKMPFYRAVQTTDTDGLVFIESLMFCNGDQAPEKKSNDTMRLCSLEADLSKIPQELFRKERNSQGVEYFEIHFDLVMIPTSASLLFELEFNGVPYGSVRSKY